VKRASSRISEASNHSQVSTYNDDENDDDFDDARFWRHFTCAFAGVITFGLVLIFVVFPFLSRNQTVYEFASSVPSSLPSSLPTVMASSPT
jgi:hypothetical protein